MRHVRRFGDGDDVRLAQHPCERHLRGRHLVALRNNRQRIATRQPPLLHGTIGGERHAARLQGGQEVELRAAPGHVVEHLVGDAGLPACAEQLVHVGRVKVADAPGRDLTGRTQRLHALYRLGQRDRAAPVQQVEIQPVGAQPPQAGLTGALKPAAARVLRVGLADEEDLVAQAVERLPEEALRLALAVHLGGVDHGHAEFDARAERPHLGLAA